MSLLFMFFMLVVTVVFVIPVALAVVALTVLGRRRRQAPTPPVIGELNTGLASIERRINNLESIMMDAKP